MKEEAQEEVTVPETKDETVVPEVPAEEEPADKDAEEVPAEDEVTEPLRKIRKILQKSRQRISQRKMHLRIRTPKTPMKMFPKTLQLTMLPKKQKQPKQKEKSN